jgi:hypothetical protein
MERIITVKGTVGRYDIPSFTYADNETLTLRLNILESKAGLYVAVVTCGEQKKKVYLKEDTKIKIPPDFIKKGGFKPIVVLLEYRTKQGDIVIIPNNPDDGGFFIEPLVIEQVDENFTAQGWLSKMEAEMTKYLQRLTVVENKLAQFEDEGVPLLAENEEIKGE